MSNKNYVYFTVKYVLQTILYAQTVLSRRRWTVYAYDIAGRGCRLYYHRRVIIIIHHYYAHGAPNYIAHRYR